MARKIDRWLADVFPGETEVYSEYRSLPPRELAIVSAAVLALPQNTQFGYGWASSYAEDMDAMEADVRAGLPANEVIRRNRYLSQLDRDEQIRIGIPLLQNAGISYFRAAVPR